MIELTGITGTLTYNGEEVRVFRDPITYNPWSPDKGLCQFVVKDLCWIINSWDSTSIPIRRGSLPVEWPVIGGDSDWAGLELMDIEDVYYLLQHSEASPEEFEPFLSWLNEEALPAILNLGHVCLV